MRTQQSHVEDSPLQQVSGHLGNVNVVLFERPGHRWLAHAAGQGANHLTQWVSARTATVKR